MAGMRGMVAASLLVAASATAHAADGPGLPEPGSGMRDIVVPSPCPGPDCRPPEDGIEPEALGPRRVYVNFDAITLTRDSGWEDSRSNTSAILISSSKTLPGLRYSDVADAGGLSMSQIENLIIDRMYDLYLPYEVELVTTRPSSGNYHMIVFGSTCGAVAGADCVGISLGDCGDSMPNNVSFVFPTGMNIEDIATTAAHEVGHAFGLGHTDDLDDVMYPSIVWDAPYHFGAGDVPDGSGCGASYQDSHELLLETIGPRGADYQAPTVTITEPANATTVAPGDPLRVSASDDVAMDHIEVLVAGSLWVDKNGSSVDSFIPGWADGSTLIEARAIDHNGNVSSARVTVTVDRSEPECTGDGDCPDGQHCDSEFCVPDEDPGGGDPAGLGEPCTGNADCASGMCGQASDGEQLCSQPCADDAGCPDGFECLGGAACWPADPAEDPEPAKSILTCAVSTDGSAPAALLLALALVTVLRRRRS